MRNIRLRSTILLLFALICGCGGLRYSQLAPEAKEFRPKKIALLPADVGAYEEARGVIEGLIAGDLVRRKWFQDIVASDTISRQYQVNEEFRKAVVDYTAKLKAVNFSDPELSKTIGRIAGVDSFLVINVDYWQYTMENKERIAKVGMGVKMIDVATGIVMWKAAHHEQEAYKWIKPELAKVAKKLVSMMMDEMPH